jgi:hypothetical protein
MKAVIALGAAIFATALPLVAAAQSTSPGTTDLESQRRQRRAVVLPKPSADQVRSDADRAVSEYAGRSTDRVVRETSPVRPSARPDLDYDVRTGIQSQRLNDALRK